MTLLFQGFHRLSDVHRAVTTPLFPSDQGWCSHPFGDDRRVVDGMICTRQTPAPRPGSRKRVLDRTNPVLTCSVVAPRIGPSRKSRPVLLRSIESRGPCAGHYFKVIQTSLVVVATQEVSPLMGHPCPPTLTPRKHDHIEEIGQLPGGPPPQHRRGQSREPQRCHWPDPMLRPARSRRAQTGRCAP